MTELPTSLIVLEYIKTVLSWPVVVGTLSILFMVRFKDVIAALLGRITGMELPGGVKVTTPQYNPENKEPIKIDPPPAQAIEKNGTFPFDIGKKVAEIDADLNEFYFKTLGTKVVVIKNLLDVIWEKNPAFLFSRKPRPESIVDTVKALGDKVDPRVVKDLENIQDAIQEYVHTKKVDRNKYLKCIQASELLVDYFRRVLTAK